MSVWRKTCGEGGGVGGGLEREGRGKERWGLGGRGEVGDGRRDWAEGGVGGRSGGVGGHGWEGGEGGSG